jgi:hypothetical protein
MITTSDTENVMEWLHERLVKMLGPRVHVSQLGLDLLVEWIPAHQEGPEMYVAQIICAQQLEASDHSALAYRTAGLLRRRWEEPKYRTPILSPPASESPTEDIASRPIDKTDPRKVRA